MMTPTLPVLAIGSDRAWRARIECMLAPRDDWCWRGSFDSGALRAGVLPRDAAWLIDGDDTSLSRMNCRGAPGSARLHFFDAPTAPLLRRCLEAGAHGCLDKRAPPHIVLHALRATGTGLFAATSQLLLAALSPPVAMAAIADAHFAPTGHDLTRRQREIVNWALRGLSNKEIARGLGISPETVKTHLHRAFEREGVHGRMGLVTRHRADERDQRM